jgi:hypothetical protein
MNPIQMQSRLRVLRRWAWLIICASLVVAWTTSWTEAYIVVLLSTVSGIAVWFGGHGMRHLLHHLRLRMAGHITTATIVAYREGEQSDEFRYVALVSFVTNSGEQRQLVPLTSRYERPPQALGDAPDGCEKGATLSDAPPIGHSVRVVYDPTDPAWVDERFSWSVLGFSTFQLLAMIVLFGTLLIATLATQIPSIRHQ